MPGGKLRKNQFLWAAVLVLGLAGICQVELCGATLSSQPTFTFETVQERARALAAKEFRSEPTPEVPEALKKLTYDTYNAIRYRSEAGPWASNRMPFGIQFFHRGYLYQEPVRIHLVEYKQVKAWAFSPQQFDYETNQFSRNLTQDLQFAGLRVLYSPTPTGKKDEVAAFLGASYYRPVGIRQRYGASARAAAIDTAEPSGEEFPRFTEFWLEKPGERADYLQLYALLDSRSMAGACRFVIRPGDSTRVEVEMDLFLRKEIKKLGLAPLTSMFWMGKERMRFIPDFRPEVHDSDGLLFQQGNGQWFWRPLMNPPKTHLVSRFPVSGLRGFGLMQRERNFAAYEDLGARYEMRPSFWVEPTSAWAGGVIELVEIPTPSEYNDNIVTYWVPSQKAVAGQQLHLSYTLSAITAEPLRTNLLRVISTRLNPEHDKNPPRFILDFSGGALPTAGGAGAMSADVHSTKGELRNVVLQKNEITGGWRVFFDLVGIGSDPAELQACLKRGEESLSEIWVYRYQKP